MKTDTSLAFRCVAAASIALAGLFASVAAQAQACPAKPVHIIVPYGATGGPDLIARTVGRKLAELAGQQVVIDNRPGAAGLVGTALAAQAPADGYTLLLGDIGTLAIQPHLQKSLNYNPEKDFVPIGAAMTSPIFFAVNASVPVKDMKGLIAFLKANPKLSYGSTGIGSPHHLGMEDFLARTRTTMTHIPYNNQAQSVPALLNLDIPLLIIAHTAIRAHVDSGRVRLIGVGTTARVPFAPEVPTVAETLPGYELRADAGFLAPAGTSQDIVLKLSGWIRSILAMPDVAESLISRGAIPVISTPEEYGRSLAEGRKRYGRLIAALGLKPN